MMQKYKNMLYIQDEYCFNLYFEGQLQIIKRDHVHKLTT